MLRAEGKFMINGFLIALAAAVALLLWRMFARAQRTVPKTGEASPDFSLPDQAGRMRDSHEFRGKWLVLYFYPRDDTPDCIEQAARYRDAMHDIEALGAVVCGVSVDDSEKHAAFARKYRLPFTLLADRTGEVATRHGSLRDLWFLKFALRNTFLIDPLGKVAKV